MYICLRDYYRNYDMGVYTYHICLGRSDNDSIDQIILPSSLIYVGEISDFNVGCIA